MGVTLERVQNKFACIVGELCNEPYVLSQFAIWVDLRIAEYKANGAISLDCTGSAPEPTWLKGMKPPTAVQSDPLSLQGSPGSANRNGRQRHQGFGSSQAWASSEITHNPTSDTRLDDDFEIVEVKEEPQDFPSSFFNQNRANRKRNSVEQNQDNLIFPTHSPKMRRLSSASENTFSTPAHDSSTHQSFMSVIGISDQPSTSADNESTIRTEDSEYQKSQGTVSAEYGYDNRLNLPSSVSHDSVDLGDLEMGISIVLSETTPAQKKRKSTNFNSMSAVRRCQEWLLEHCNEHRLIETIGVEELDVQLAQFIAEVKQRSNLDYHPNSLLSLRKCIDRHLRQHMYPYSLTHDPRFGNFHQSFKKRKAELELKRAKTLREQMELQACAVGANGPNRVMP